MKMSPPQAGTPSWMLPFTDPNIWQNWFQQAQSSTENAAASATQSFGALLDPTQALKLQNDYIQRFSSLWQDFVSAKAPEIKDKRFSAPEWQANSLYAFNAAAYLLNARYLMEMAEAVQMPPRAKQKVRFAVQQLVDAMSPANFLVTNPEAQQKMLETNGKSLAKGIAHMLQDMQKGRISQSDESAFEVGRNVATTEGAVIFENELFQLIQYKPLTKTVFERPLLIVPPCINKYYILDLQPDNSLVRYAVEQGHTVFLVSWCNPDASLGHLGWDDYVTEGVMKAIEVAREVTGQEQINTLGFCVGGTLLATALAIPFAHGEKPVESLTLLTTLLDFGDTGVLDVYIDEAQVALREQTIGQGGLMPGRDFNCAFSSLRANDLVWNYVSSNYLKGEPPPAFDLLYWNADGTNLPGPMFCWYLRNTYLENNLKEPGKATVAGEKIDLSKINVPTFVYGSREDHIVPWTSAYESTQLLNPKKKRNNRFVLGASGHIAGVINPPAKKKRSYWVNDKTPASAQEWMSGATEHPGSWWEEWAKFLAKHAGRQVEAPRNYGNSQYKAIEPAPGRYVRVKAA
ncbi:class I poly(R)-hydroxyalkanoic acid synthase [Noviherbaspirillum massiliense]|uniref:class I poly(R)-hydroxyalkanoic acid synthase n=1 Tax=Noviherbaspirillum massiliense TaxID=1465823 RepID=UPI00030F3A6E|nr:class I poly(R)-hydroxyalkanoic acid synthase [Noviherbaspirillum massiliense]